MPLRICIVINKYAASFSCSTSNTKSSEEMKDNFYSELRNQVRSTSNYGRRLGNFNAHVGCDASLWSSFINKHAVDKAKSNGHLLISLFNENGVLITK